MNPKDTSLLFTIYYPRDWSTEKVERLLMKFFSPHPDWFLNWSDNWTVKVFG